jgi:cytochrome c6
MKRFAIAAALILAAAAARAEDAAALYQSKCKMCHGADGKGTPVGLKMGAPDLTAEKHPAAEAAKEIENGKGKMPAFKGKLTDAEIKALAAYVANGLK